MQAAIFLPALGMGMSGLAAHGFFAAAIAESIGATLLGRLPGLTAVLIADSTGVIAAGANL